MRSFKVRCYKAGIWDEQAEVEIEADSAFVAAVAICRVELSDRGVPSTLRVEVWPEGEPGKKSLFYEKVAHYPPPWRRVTHWLKKFVGDPPWRSMTI